MDPYESFGRETAKQVVQDMKAFFNLVAEANGYSPTLVRDVFTDLKKIVDFNAGTALVDNTALINAFGSAEVAAIDIMRTLCVQHAQPTVEKAVKELYRAMEENAAMRELKFKPIYKL